VALLKAFTDSQPELGLPELVSKVGLNKATAYRLLRALESEGMVERNPDTDGFRLGPEVVALGGRAGRARDLRSLGRPELAKLAHETGETATLEVLVGDQVQILEESPGSHVLGSVRAIGTRWPAHATSTGKVLVAHLTEPERQAFLSVPRTSLTPRTITAAHELRRELAAVLDRGYAVTREELEPDFIAVGAPVRDGDGRVTAAISVGGPRQRLGPRKLPSIAVYVRHAAHRLSERLGYQGVGDTTGRGGEK
jgi:DNA-binding IclR family transcriptional regulator